MSTTRKWSSGGTDLETVAKGLERMRGDLERLRGTERTPELLSIALAYWKGYNRLLASIGHDDARKRDDISGAAYGILNATHQAAARVLMELAEHFGIDAARLWEAAMVCETLLECEPWRYERKPAWKWPECLGEALLELPADLRQTIQKGDSIIERIRTRANISEQAGRNALAGWFATKATKPRGGRPRKWDDLASLDAEMHAKNPDVEDKEVIQRYNRKHAGPIGKGQREKATVRTLREARSYRRMSKITKRAGLGSTENPAK